MKMRLRIGNQLFERSQPCVMSIVNLSPDSFVPSCHCVTEVQALTSVASALQQGAAIIDIGACSTRPNSVPVSEEQEWQRLHVMLRAIRNAFPDAILSLDTFRPAIARKAIEDYGVQIINDVSGGCDEMFDLVTEKQVPYILTFSRPLSEESDVVIEAVDFFVREADRLHRMGVADIIIDPGFGFGKTIEQNYTLLQGLDKLKMLHLPILVGISRKSMIYKRLNCSPEEALNGTTVLHTIAIQKGADILRVHDTQAAQQVIQLCSAFK